MSRRQRRLIPLLLAPLAILALTPALAAGAQDTVRTLTQQVRRVIANPDAPPDDSVFFALRELRDERLRPLFAEIASREEPAYRLHGIFGLADISEDRRLNIIQIERLTPRRLRALALGRAIGADYLTPEQMRQALTWPELEPGLELLIIAKLRRAGDEPEVDRLREIADRATEQHLPSRVFAQLLIAQIEEDPHATAAQQTIQSVAEEDRDTLATFALVQILSENLDNLLDFVLDIHQQADASRALRLQSLAALLALDPERALAEWRKAYDAEQSLSERIRLALVLVDAAPTLPADAFDPLIGDEIALLDRMGRAAAAIAAETDEAPALWSLLSQGHQHSIMWAFAEIDDMDEARRARVLRDILTIATADRSPDDDVPAVLYEAARSLEQTEPGALAPYLEAAAADKDARLCEALLVALVETEPHLVWDEAHPPDWPNRRSRALAVVAEARARKPLSDDELDLLISVGMGGEALPPAFRVQAAWLALCQLQKEREALAEVLAPADE